MCDAAIELKGVVRRFPSFTLGPLDLTVPRGSIVGYIGQNGAGKSTTIKLLLGLLRPENGTVRVLGQAVGEDPAYKDKIGVVFDDLALPGNVTLEDAARFAGSVYSGWDQAQFERCAARFQLPKGQAVKGYSRGMKMKLSMAIALSHHAELLILDEATSGLDPIVRDEILDMLLDFMQDERHTIFISSHILSDLEKVADYIAFLDRGKLLLMEGKDELKENYAVCAVTEAQFAALDPAHIVGTRSHAFGKEVLLKRGAVPEGVTASKPGIEDIMIYFVKGEKR